jgi:hypothetical protein
MNLGFSVVDSKRGRLLSVSEAWFSVFPSWVSASFRSVMTGKAVW